MVGFPVMITFIITTILAMTVIIGTRVIALLITAKEKG